jgi:uncharacterized short protein YbdD (DUF466 family)
MAQHDAAGRGALICRCFGRDFDIAAIGRRVAAAADLMVGVPDYNAYAAHQAATHPDQPVMTQEAFFRERQAKRYGAGRGLRCC